MKRYNATQVRLIWNIVIIAVLVAGVYVIWLFPGIDLKAADIRHMPTRNSTTELGLDQKNVVSTQHMQTFIASMRQSRTIVDPFLRAGEEEWKAFLGELKARPPRLQGIIAVRETRIALIDGSRYKTGDDVKGFTIQTVSDTEVVLVKDDKHYTLHLDH